MREMHFLRTGGADHAHDLAARRSANDGVVDQDNALAFEQIADRVQLQLHAEVADALLGLDERPADIVVADQAESKRNAAFGCVPNGRRHAGVGHGNDEISGDVRLAGELAAHLLAALLHPAVEDFAVGAREVDLLEDAA